MSPTYVEMLQELQPTKITSFEQHQSYLSRLMKIWDKPVGDRTDAEKSLEGVLSALVEQYERDYRPPATPLRPGELTWEYMGQDGTTLAELAALINRPGLTEHQLKAIEIFTLTEAEILAQHFKTKKSRYLVGIEA